MKSKMLIEVACAVAMLTAGGVSGAIEGRLPAAPADTDFYDKGAPPPDEVALGRLLFFDKLLSGNRNISCASCHHALTDTGDGLSLPVGEGGKGLGVTRDTGTGLDAVHERVPRNAPPIFNLGAREFRRLFHDGRVEPDPSHPSGFRSPAGDDLPPGLDNVLAVQAMFPVTSGTEMAGQAGENAVADAAAAGDLAGPRGVWAQLAARLRSNDEYARRFTRVYGLSSPKEITFVHAANAIAAFEASAWRADNSPFDRYLRGDRTALSLAQRRGMRIFYDPRRGNCARCHAGPFQTDHSFRAIGMPQIGPGKGDGWSGHEDFGRSRVSGRDADRFRFRVPSLRNVALTAPYGHAGAFATLESVVRHHLDARQSLFSYDTGEARLPPRADLAATDFFVMANRRLLASIADAAEIKPLSLSNEEISDLLEFLHALTDRDSLDLRDDVPLRVPSGLSVAD